MKRMLVLVLLLNCTTSSFAAFSGFDYFYAHLLISKSADDVLLGAKLVLKNKMYNNIDLLDLSAYMLSQDLSSREMADAYSYLAKYIGLSGNGRYRTVLDAIITDETATDKIKRHAGRFIAHLPSENVPQFVADDYDFAGVKKQLWSFSGFNSRNIHSFARINLLDSIEDVHERAGYPSFVVSHISPEDSFSAPWGKVLTKVHGLQFIYHGIGILQFGSNGVSNIFPVFPELRKFNVGENASLLNQIYTNRVMMLRKAARVIASVEDQYLSTYETDAIAYRIWMERKTIDKDMSDAMAWLCKPIIASRNPRYRDIFNTIKADASDGKIRKYAKRCLRSMPKTEKEQFRPESVIKMEEKQLQPEPTINSDQADEYI